jgi:hypothetical protein
MASPTSEVMMAKAKSKSSSRTKSQKFIRSVRSRASKGTPRVSKQQGSATKHNRVLAMLRLKGGVTIAAIVRATGWQPHSVRGFLAGVVKKKLGLNLTSEKTKSGRVYRVTTAKPLSAGRSETAELAHG